MVGLPVDILAGQVDIQLELANLLAVVPIQPVLVLVPHRLDHQRQIPAAVDRLEAVVVAAAVEPPVAVVVGLVAGLAVVAVGLVVVVAEGELVVVGAGAVVVVEWLC